MQIRMDDPSDRLED